MGSRLLAVQLTLFLAAWATGCAQPPTERVNAAKAALQGLPADAAVYAPEALKAAQDAGAALDAELAARSGDYFPSYDRAEQLAAALEDATAKVAPAVTAGQERLRTQTTQTIADARRTLAAAQESAAALPARQVPAERRSEWQTDTAGVETSLTEVDRLLAAGQLAEAGRQAEAAMKAATEVSTAVAEVQGEVQQAQEAAAELAAKGDVTLPRRLMADGQALSAGTYMLRLGDEVKTPAGGTERWVEFVRSGKVAGRALAVMVPDAEIREIAESAGPRNGVRSELLKGGDYYRVWLNRGGVNYLIHLPPPAM
jgi:hypothetical protein